MNTSTVPGVFTLSKEAIDATAEGVSRMDEETFRAFYDRTARPLWLYLSRITGDRQLADDLLQDAYYRFYRAGDAYESEHHRRNALFRIATNLARDAYRRRHGTTEAPLTDGISPVESRSGAVETRTDLTRAMARLKPEQREMLWLAYAHGSSHQEIAEITGVTRASVKSLLFRARQQLASILRSGRIAP